MADRGLLWKIPIAAAAATLVAGLAINSIASATPPSEGIVTAPIANGVIDGKLKAKDYGIELKTKGDVRVLDATLTYPAGTNSGWHEHPGVVIATVIAGSVRRTLGCGPAETFEPNESFVEVGPHYVENLGPGEAKLSVTVIVPPQFSTAPSRRIDVPEPDC